MEKAISAADANRKFPQLLREVKEGRTFVVTSQGGPVARISPAEEQRRSKAKGKLLAHLESQPVRRVGGWNRDDLCDRCDPRFAVHMRVALDPNVLAYAEGIDDLTRRKIAVSLVSDLYSANTFLSIQVLGELFRVLRKARYSAEQARTAAPR